MLLQICLDPGLLAVAAMREHRCRIFSPHVVSPRTNIPRRPKQVPYRWRNFGPRVTYAGFKIFFAARRVAEADESILRRPSYGARRTETIPWQLLSAAHRECPNNAATSEAHAIFRPQARTWSGL